ncbi:unnamed protein product [Adineta steineri]|uniref:Protein FAM221A n=1 Tax=Adineta steineri TaxID=433720 RepID=A0A814ZDG1_9BILA|nr:unnamed protein product [Adineta steineri]
MLESNRGCAPSDYINLPPNAAAHVVAYFEYCADSNCRYKHSLDTHETRPPYTCQKDCNCSGFRVPFTCICGEPAYKHMTLVETKQEREQCGHPTGYATRYKAMGDLTGFSSSAEGYLRLDPGPPADDFLNQPITAMDHSILRAHVFLDPNSAEAQSQLRRPGESESDYYEHRYKSFM